MLSFKPYLPDNKDLSFANQDEDPSNNLFEQYLNEDPISFNDAIEDHEGFHAFDFAFDEETESSESCSADSKNVEVQSAQEPQLSTSFNQAPLQQPSPLRIRSRLLSRDIPAQSISGNELLNLEGKAPPVLAQTQPATRLPSSSGAPTLRRKSKFYDSGTETGRSKSHKISKASSGEMLHPSYSYENSSYNEWTERFEQISIQNQTAESHASPSHASGTYRDKRPNKILTSFHQASQQNQPPPYSSNNGVHQSQESAPIQGSNFNAPATAPLPQTWHCQEASQPSPMTQGDFNYFSEKRPSLDRSQTQQLHHVPSWGYQGPISPLTPDFLAPSTDIQSDWLQNLPDNNDTYAIDNDNSKNNNNAYFVNNQTNNSISQSSHGLPTNPETDYITQSLGFQYESFNQFINEDPSTDYSVLSSNPLLPHSDPNTQPQNHHPNHGLPTTPSTSPPLHPSPSKPHLRTKSSHLTPHHRRQKSMSALTHRAQKSLSLSHSSNPNNPTNHPSLKTPKSASALKTRHSQSGLKSPSKSSLKSSRSANGLRPSSKSVSGVAGVGGGGAGAGSGAGNGGFGFVNFTEADKGKILTGVAPSGSSKTKARREMEASEKKRKLSEAAKRIVEEAGGDVGVLRELGEF